MPTPFYFLLLSLINQMALLIIQLFWKLKFHLSEQMQTYSFWLPAMKNVLHMNTIIPFSLFLSKKILLLPHKLYLEFIQFIFLKLKQNLFTSFLNNLISNLSLFFDNSRKCIAIAFHYNPQKQSLKGIS